MYPLAFFKICLVHTLAFGCLWGVSLTLSNLIFTRMSVTLRAELGHIAFHRFILTHLFSLCVTKLSFWLLNFFHVESSISWGVVEDAMLIIRGDKYPVWRWRQVSWGPKERDDIQSNTITYWSIQRQEASFNCPETRGIGQKHMVNFSVVLLAWLLSVCGSQPYGFSTLQNPAWNEEHWFLLRILRMQHWRVRRGCVQASVR